MQCLPELLLALAHATHTREPKNKQPPKSHKIILRVVLRYATPAAKQAHCLLQHALAQSPCRLWWFKFVSMVSAPTSVQSLVLEQAVSSAAQLQTKATLEQEQQAQAKTPVPPATATDQ